MVVAGLVPIHTLWCMALGSKALWGLLASRCGHTELRFKSLYTCTNLKTNRSLMRLLIVELLCVPPADALVPPPSRGVATVVIRRDDMFVSSHARFITRVLQARGYKVRHREFECGDKKRISAKMQRETAEVLRRLREVGTACTMVLSGRCTCVNPIGVHFSANNLAVGYRDIYCQFGKGGN